MKEYQEPNREPDSGFRPPNRQRREKALGHTVPRTRATAKAIANPEKFWIPMRIPEEDDWLDSYNHGGQGFDKFGGKAYSDRFNTLYIQPITKDAGSKITDRIFNKL